MNPEQTPDGRPAPAGPTAPPSPAFPLSHSPTHGAASARPPPNIPDHELLRCIGRGAYGDVWLARTVMGEFRAVKIVYRQSFENDRPYERELAGIRKFEPISRSHEGLVDILHVGHNEAAGYFYYMMELADNSSAECGVRSAESENEKTGKREDEQHEPVALSSSRLVVFPFSCDDYSPKTLRAEIKRRGRLPFAECLQLGLALTEALEYLHAHGLVHRDIKPSNIIFVDGVPKLADIGLVAETDATRSLVGTDGFIPPEGPGTPQGDLYSLGKVLYEIATGKDRHHFPEPPTHLDEFPERTELAELNEVILRACEPEPGKRYDSARKMHDDLQLLQRGRSLRRLHKLERKLRLTIRLGCAAGVLGFAAFAVLQSRTAAAQARARLAGEREQQQRRQVLIQQIQMSRLGAHEAGWSDQVWQRVAEAANIHKDADLQGQAAASLAGLDARLLKQLTNYSVCAIAFDHQGKSLLMAGTVEGARLWDCDTGDLRFSSLAKPGPVAFSGDGTPLHFAAEGHGRFLLWDVAQQQAVRQFTIRELAEPGSWPTWVRVPQAITPDASRVAAAACFADGSGSYAAWEASSGRLLLEGSGKVFSLGFTPDGSLLAAGDDDGNIAVWSVADARKLAALKDGRLSIRSLAFQADPRRSPVGGGQPPALPGESSSGTRWLLAAGDEGGTVTIWDVAAETVRTRLVGSPFHVYTVAFSPDGTLLASAGRFRATVWDLATGKSLMHLSRRDALTSVAFSPDGRRLAIGSMAVWNYSGAVEVWDLEPGRGVRTLRGLEGQVSRVWFSSDQKWLAAMAHNWRLGLWEVATGRLRHVIEMPKGEIGAYAFLAFSPDGRQFAFGTTQAVGLWDLESGRELHSKHGAGVCSLAFSEEGRLVEFDFVLEGGEKDPSSTVGRTEHSYRVLMRDFLSQRSLASLPAVDSPDFVFYSLTLIEQGELVIVCGVQPRSGKDSTLLKAIDGASGNERWSLTSPFASAARGLACDPRGRFFAWPLGDQGTLQLMECASGRPVRALKCMPEALSPTGELGAVRISDQSRGDGFEFYTPSEVAPVLTLLSEPLATQTSPQFSSDGNLFAWGNGDGKVSLCDLTEVRQRLAKLGLGW